MHQGEPSCLRLIEQVMGRGRGPRNKKEAWPSSSLLPVVHCVASGKPFALSALNLPFL